MDVKDVENIDFGVGGAEALTLNLQKATNSKESRSTHGT